MRPILTVLFPILLMGSAMGGELEWETKELERKAKVQALIKRLADESSENRQAAYTELRDTFVRKRDIPELTKEIARNANPEVKKSLGELIPFMEGRWRLPDKGWTTDLKECDKLYEKAFEDLGCEFASVAKKLVYRKGAEYPVELFLWPSFDDQKDPIENRAGMINLILTLEPQSLSLLDYWVDITFVATLTNLELLELQGAKVTDLTPLKGLTKLWDLSLLFTEVTDLTPLKGLPDLHSLDLQHTGVTDLAPLKGLQNLRHLSLQNTGVTDLTPLKGMPKLWGLWLENTGVTDLTPLNDLPELRSLNLENTKVTDLTPLKDLPQLDNLNLKNTGVTDVTPLKGLPELRYLVLENSKVTDLTPLKEMQELQIIEGTE